MANLNETQSSERLHISFFGKRNVGKSSLVNAITNQQMSIVSNVKGTTTDPVKKTMEILPLGPVVIIDTPGIDDEGYLGDLRVNKARDILNKTDIAILVIDVSDQKEKIDDYNEFLINEFKNKKIPYIISYNKCDVLSKINFEIKNNRLKENEILISAEKNINIEQLKILVSKIEINKDNNNSLVRDFVNDKDTVILVMPQDSSAPKGRLILPQVQMIRDLLDNHCIVISTQVEELENSLNLLSKNPSLVITDSQVFKEVEQIIPKNIKLTSFSILLAKYKGLLNSAVEGVTHINDINKDDKILIVEACPHHRQCEDIGTVKIPKLLKNKLGFEVKFDTNSGNELSKNLDEYKMIIHCGGCMITEKEMKNRLNILREKNIPITNYGILIAYLQGILYRCLEIMPDLQCLV